MEIAIIGAGAAGCFAAANIAGVDNTHVTIYEKTGKALQKVKVSGGGRCNVTHECFDVQEMAKAYPRGSRLLRKTLHRFGPQDTINWFQQRGVALKAEADGRMFPTTDNSQTIIDCIWQEMMQRRVDVRYHKGVTSLEKATDTGKFLLRFSDQSTANADLVLVAAGGFPKTGQYSWLQALGHNIVTPVPSLFTFNIPNNPITSLMGVSVPDATIRITGTKIVQSGPVLITHWGLSGPAILKTSAIAARELADTGYQFSVTINWLGDVDETDVKETFADQRSGNGGAMVAQRNPFGLPRRLWEHLLSECGVDDKVRWGELPATAQNKLTMLLVRQPFQVSGKTTFKEEFVTCGGVKLSETDPATMESRIVPGLYFAGELMDVDGITGGYNFQHAWSSAFIAASAINDKIKSPVPTAE